ncbi:hypothetical protein JCM10049v2_002747 [Rhodotorula toruloides]
MDNTGAGIRPPSLTQPLVSLASISTEHFRPSPLTLDWLYSLPLPPGCPVQPFPQTSEDWALVEQYRLLCQGLTVMAEYERERARRQQRGEDPDAQPWDPRTSDDPAVVFAAECLFNGPDWVESEDHASSPSEHDDAAYEVIDSPSQAADAAFLGVLSAVQQQQQRNASSSSSTSFTTSIPLSLSDLTALSSALPLSSSSSSQPPQTHLSPSQIPADGILSDSALSPASLPSLMSAIAELEQCVARLSLEASEARRLQRRMRGAVVGASAANVGAVGDGEAEAAKKKGKNRKKKKKVAPAPPPPPPLPPAVPAPPAPKQREGAGGDDSDLLNALHSVSMLDRRADEYRERLRVLKEQIHHHAAIADRLASSAAVSAPNSPAGQGANGHAHVHGDVDGEGFEEYEEEEEEVEVEVD